MSPPTEATENATSRTAADHMGDLEARAYLNGKFAQLETAIAQGNGAVAFAIIKSFGSDGHPEVQTAILDALLDGVREQAAAMFTSQPDTQGEDR